MINSHRWVMVLVVPVQVMRQPDTGSIVGVIAKPEDVQDAMRKRAVGCDHCGVTLDAGGMIPCQA